MKWTLVNADALTGLASLRDGYVHCCVTSPPYYGLRDYAGVDPIRWPDEWVGKLGLEPTPELYVDHLVQIFREVRRVTREDGSLWLNLGDSYASNRGALLGIPHRVAHALQADGWCLRSTIIWAKPCPMPESVSGWRWERCRTIVSSQKSATESNQYGGAIGSHRHRPHSGGVTSGVHAEYKTTYEDCPGCPKCEPNDGYVLRRGRWRPTTAHEYVFLLSPGGGPYFGDGEAVREPDKETDHRRNILHKPEPSGGIAPPHVGIRRSDGRNGAGRNPRNVWEIGPEPYSGAHYASFPTELPRRCITAGTAPAVCSKCGAPHAPVVTIESMSNYSAHLLNTGRSWRDIKEENISRGMGDNATSSLYNSHVGAAQRTFNGYRPTCDCNSKPSKSLVLDPFAGTGTTGAAAVELGRSFIGIDQSLAYLAQDARQRIGSRDVEHIQARAPRMPSIDGPLFCAERVPPVSTEDNGNTEEA